MITRTKQFTFMASAATVPILLAGTAVAQLSLINTDDTFATNDVAVDPTATNNRNDFFEVRNHPATRKRIGYVKYDISSIDPALFPTAVLSGLFHSGRNGEGPITIFGLNDGEDNVDDVPDGSFNEANWTEGTLSYSMGLGVDTSILPETVGNTLANVGIDLTEVTQLGVMNSVAGDDIFLTNTTDAALGDFLAADMNGVVTFLLADVRDASVMDNTEWRITAREMSAADSLQLLFFPTPGDTNLDEIVDLDDLVPIRTNYNMAGGYTDGDLNNDGLVSFGDFRVWKTAILEGGGSLAGVDLGFLTVAEPSAALLLLVASIGMQATRRARRYRSQVTCCNSKQYTIKPRINR